MFLRATPPIVTMALSHDSVPVSSKVCSLMFVSKVGDRVLLMETRPLSKDKRWRVVEIIEKAK